MEHQEITFDKEKEIFETLNDNEEYILNSQSTDILNLHNYCDMLDASTSNIVDELEKLAAKINNLDNVSPFGNTKFYKYLEIIKIEMGTELLLKHDDIREGINDKSFAPFRKYLNAYKNKHSITCRAEEQMHAFLYEFLTTLTKFALKSSCGIDILEQIKNILLNLSNLHRARCFLIDNAETVDKEFLICNNQYWNNFNMVTDLTNLSNDLSDVEVRTNFLNKSFDDLTRVKYDVGLKVEEINKNILELQDSSVQDKSYFRTIGIERFIESTKYELEHCNIEKLFHLEQISKLKFVIDTSNVISMLCDDTGKSDVNKFVMSLEQHVQQINMFVKKITEKLNGLQAKLNSTDDILSKFLLNNIGEVNKRQEEYSQIFNELNEIMDETPEFCEQVAEKNSSEQLRTLMKRAAKLNIHCETKLGALKQNYQIFFKKFTEIKDHCKFIFSVDDALQNKTEDSEEDHGEEFGNIQHTETEPTLLHSEKLEFCDDEQKLKNKIAELKASLIDHESLLKIHQDLQEKIMHQAILMEPYKKQLQEYEEERKNLLRETEDMEKELEVKNLVCAALLGHQNRKQKLHHVIQLQTQQRELFQTRNLLLKKDTEQTKHIRQLEMELNLVKGEHLTSAGESPLGTPSDLSSLSKSSSLKTLTSSEASLSSIKTDSSTSSWNYAPKIHKNKLPVLNLTVPRSPFERSPSKTRRTTCKFRRASAISPKNSPKKIKRRGQSLGPTNKTASLGRPSTGHLSSTFKSYQKISSLERKSPNKIENCDKDDSSSSETTQLLNVTFTQNTSLTENCSLSENSLENSKLMENFPASKNCSLTKNFSISENCPSTTKPSTESSSLLVGESPALPVSPILRKSSSAIGKSPKVVGKSPSIVNKCPSLRRKSPLLVGKSPSRVKTSTLQIGRSSIVMKSPSLDLTIPESPFEDESPKRSQSISCNILTEKKNLRHSLLTSPVRSPGVSGKNPKRIFKSSSLSLTVPKSPFSQYRTTARDLGNTLIAPGASPNSPRKTISPPWALTIPASPFDSPRKINSRFLHDSPSKSNLIKNNSLLEKVDLKNSQSSESRSEKGESPTRLRKVDSAEQMKTPKSTKGTSSIIERIIHSSVTQTNLNSTSVTRKDSKDASIIPSPKSVVRIAARSPSNIVEPRKLTRSRHSKSKIPLLISPLQSPTVSLQDLTNNQHCISMNLPNGNINALDNKMVTSSDAEISTEQQRDLLKSSKTSRSSETTKSLPTTKTADKKSETNKPVSRLLSLCKRFGKFQSPKVGKP